MSQTNCIMIRCQGSKCGATKSADSDLPRDALLRYLVAEMVACGWLVWERNGRTLAYCPKCKEGRR